MNEIKAHAQNVMTNLVAFELNLVSRFFPDFVAEIIWKLFTSPHSKQRPLQGVFSKSPPFIDHKIAGETVRVYKFGVSNTKRVLLVHGWESEACDFFKFIPPLLDAGYEVICFDGPAHGASSGKQTNAMHFAQVISELHDIYGSFNSIIAHSFGGMASALSINLFARIGRPKLVTVGTPLALERILAVASNRFKVSPRVQARLTTRIENQFGLRVSAINTGTLIAQAQINAYIVHDKKDRQVPVIAAEHIARKANAQTLITEGLGHNRILRNDDVIQKIVSFIC